jgi:hypothetical protein
MFTIKAKLNDGRSLSATVGGAHMAEALTAVTAKLPEGVSIVGLKMNAAGAGSLKIGPARKAKEVTPATPVAAPDATKAPEVTETQKRKR